MTSSLHLYRLSKTFRAKGATVTAVDDLNIDVAEGEILVLLGPSGCGKSTTLRMVAGLEVPTSGVVQFGDRTVFDAGNRVNIAVHRRDIGMVFQSFGLWPHMTVRRNIEYPLRARRGRQQVRSGSVERVAQMVECDRLLERYPGQLSGGQQQRVALARALVAEPSIVLFDEPLSSLDARLRTQLRAELRQLHTRVGFTGLYVTHDQAEAFALADRIAVMRDGQIEQLDVPRAVFETPSTAYVAEFIGIPNRLGVSRNGDGWTSDAGHLLGDAPGWSDHTELVFVRPERCRLLRDCAASAEPGELVLPRATVQGSVYGGRHNDVSLSLENGSKFLVSVPATGENYQEGQPVQVSFGVRDSLTFDAAGRRTTPSFAEGRV